MMKIPPVKNLPYTAHEAAQMLGVADSTVHYWISLGKLEAVPVVGTAVLVTPQSLRKRLREVAAKEKTDDQG